jgi:hypothetical protein
MEEQNINHYMSICFKNNVKIYPIIFMPGYMKIEVDYAGRIKKGTEKYNSRTEQKQLQEKIQELYETIAKRIQSRGD